MSREYRYERSVCDIHGHRGSARDHSHRRERFRRHGREFLLYARLRDSRCGDHPRRPEPRGGPQGPRPPIRLDHDRRRHGHNDAAVDNNVHHGASAYGDAVARPGGHRARHHGASHRVLRRDNVRRLDSRLRRLRRCRRHAHSKRDELYEYVDSENPARRLPHPSLWPRRLLDRNGRRAQLPRRNLPPPPPRPPLALQEHRPGAFCHTGAFRPSVSHSFGARFNPQNVAETTARRAVWGRRAGERGGRGAARCRRAARFRR